jgi:chemotaxis protein methyltransferase CheR
MVLAGMALPAFIENAEFSLTANDVGIIVKIMAQEAGIALSVNKINLIYSRLAKRLRSLNLKSFTEYCKILESEEGKEERREMVAALTTNVTRFFREPHHFVHFRGKILPNLIKRAREGEKIRLWSSACSNGAEPYSIALTLLSAMPDACHYDIKILATDIDSNVLKLGEIGVYEIGALAPVPLTLRNTWFMPTENGANTFRVNDELRRLVSFRQLNLIGPWPMRRKFQTIFCRNVVIYFDLKTQEALWSRMVPILDKDGILYIGHSERITGPAATMLINDGITTYHKCSQGDLT